MRNEIQFRAAVPADALRLSILFMQVHIHTYGIEGVSTEFANFISKQFAVEKIERSISEHPGKIIVATYHDNLIGVAAIELDKKCPVGDLVAPELSKLYVLDRFNGMGVGHGLINRAEQFLKENGYTKTWLWVWQPNEHAIKFYEKHGYKWIGNAFFQMEYNNYENQVMWKEL